MSPRSPLPPVSSSTSSSASLSSSPSSGPAGEETPDGDQAVGGAASAGGAGAFDRRSVLWAGLVGVAGVGLACDRSPSGASSSPPSSPPSGPPTPASAAQGAQAFLPVLVALAERLLPDDDTGPGARAAGVAGFLDRVFDDTRLAAVHPLLKRGCAFLMRAAQANHGRAFVALGPAEQDELIGQLVEGKMRPDGFSGPTFVRVVLALTLEGFLGDPRHGGNRDGVGWRFVGFSPDGRAQGLAQPVPTSSTSSPSSPPSSTLPVVP